MKKFLAFVITAFMLTFYNLNINASIFEENPADSPMADIITNTEFNVIKGISDTDELMNSSFYQMINEMDTYVYSGIIKAYTDLYFNYDSVYIEVSFVYNNGEFDYVSVSLELEEFYRFHKEGDSLVIDLNKEVDLYYINNEYADDGSVMEYPRIDVAGMIYESGYDANSIDYYLLEEQSLTCFYGMIYKENSVYHDQDVHLVVSYDSPLTIEKLLESMTIFDNSTQITEYDIDNNTYILDENGKIATGEYGFKIVASDSYGHVTVQRCIVTVSDIINPTIKFKEENAKIVASYTKELSEEDILNYFEFSDSSGIKYALVKMDNYILYSDTIGEYDITIEACDNNYRTSILNTTITVKDDIGPIVANKDLTVTYPYNQLTEDEIKAAITASDTIDGNLNNDNVILDEEDLKNYYDNYSLIGTYNIKATVYDHSGNSTEANILITVVDNDYPKIYLDTYTIVIPKGDILSETDIKELLISTGQINSSEEITLSSLYFAEENPEGVYDLEILLSDGTIITDRISIAEDSEKSTISYDTPLKTNDEGIDPVMIVAISIAGVMIICIIVIGVFIYKKRH